VRSIRQWDARGDANPHNSPPAVSENEQSV
jgi:hypothetical protein